MSSEFSQQSTSPVERLKPSLIAAADIAFYDGGDQLLRMNFTEAGWAKMASYAEASTGNYLALTLDGIVLGTTEMTNGQGLYGAIQIPIANEDSVGMTWLNLDGNSPLPVPLVERSYSTVASPGSAAPSGPTVVPWPPAPPTPIVPTPDATGTYMIYVVVPGDTLSAIAARFNVSLASLEAANPLLGPGQLIEIGWTLNIPPPR